MIHAIFSALGENPSFTIVSFTSKENFWSSWEMWDFIILILGWSLKWLIISLIISSVATHLDYTKSFISMLFQLSCTHRYFELESASWSDPSGADERAKPWLSGPRAVYWEARHWQQLIKCWFSFKIDSNVFHSTFLFFRSECKGWQICYVQLCSESLNYFVQLS